MIQRLFCTRHFLIVTWLVFLTLGTFTFFQSAVADTLSTKTDEVVNIEEPEEVLEEAVAPEWSSGPVVVAEVSQDIRAGTVQYIERALNKADEINASLFVLKLNTPGGLLKATEDISRALLASPVPTMVYIHEESGWAFSAGAYIALSADLIASTESGMIGSAEPVDAGGESAGEKVVNASEVWIRSLAERQGKDADVAGSFVTENISLSAGEAREQGIVDYLGDSLDSVLAEIGLSDREIITVEPTFFDNVLSFVSLPYLIPLLLSLGAVGLFFVFRTGEFDSIGMLGIVFLLIGLWGMGAVQLSVIGSILLVFGTLMIILGFTLEGSDFGIIGVIGLISLFFGIVTFASEPFFPSYVSQALFWVVMGVGVSVGLMFFVMGRLSLSAQLLPIRAGMEAYIGKRVPVVSKLSPAGSVVLGGEQYSARLVESNKTEVPEGVMVEVVKTEGNTILVREIPDGE